jgi:hypothetical protein
MTTPMSAGTNRVKSPCSRPSPAGRPGGTQSGRGPRRAGRTPGRGEIFRVFRLAHPEINVIAIRANEPVLQMIDRARAHAAEAFATPLVIPTVRELLEEIRAGRETRAMIPVPPGRKLTPGDRVIFAEATFSPFGTPSLIDGGQSLSVTLTTAEDTGGIYQTARIIGIGWEPVALDVGRPGVAQAGGRT